MTDAWEYLVWIDVETTGLKMTDRLLEVAAVVTQMDPEFVQVGEPFQRVIGLEDAKIQDVDPHVLRMHASNGLWEDAQKSRLTRTKAMIELHKWFTEIPGLDGCRFYWAGRSLHFDLQWLSAANLEGATDRDFSHRRFDIRPVTALLSLAGVDLPEAEETHRALNDVLGDIELARQIVSRLRS